MSKKRKVMVIVISIILAAVIFVSLSYFRELNIAKERFKPYQEKAKTIQTLHGSMSYIDEGEGEVILSLHGICGGYDQAYDTLADKVDSYRVIAPSRFGYPGSDIPDNPSVEKQVEALVDLLNQLNIDKVYLLGTSAGGATAIKFALLYPERIKGLILFCSGYPGTEEPEKKLIYVGPPKTICYDFPMWLFSPLFGPFMGMDRDTIKVIMPLGERHKGIVLDAKIANTDMDNNYDDYDMSDMKVPTLILHAEDDKLADYRRAVLWSKKIPDCTFISFEQGGHLMADNCKKISNALDSFIYGD